MIRKTTVCTKVQAVFYCLPEMTGWILFMAESFLYMCRYAIILQNMHAGKKGRL